MINPKGWPEVWVTVQTRMMYDFWEHGEKPFWGRKDWARKELYYIGGVLGVAEGAD